MSEIGRLDWLEEPPGQVVEGSRPSRRPLPQMRAWQERILNVLLLSTSVLGLFAVIAAFTLLIPAGLWSGVIVVAIVYALFPLLTVLRRIPGAIRAVAFLVLFYFLGALALAQAALGGPGRLLMLAFPLIAFVLLGRVAGLVAAGVGLLTQIVIGWLMVSGTLPVLVQVDPTSAASWYSSTAVWILMVVVILFPVGYLVNNLLVNLDQALGEAQRRWRELSRLSRSLEQQVEERTEELARRSAKLEASLQVSRDAAAIREVDRLLDETVHLISERFGFYHAGIFLLDEDREYAVLRAASSEGGRRMLARGHRLRVGQVGIVGFVAGSGQPRIALDVGEDAVFFDNPDLPHTRSEIGLPLRVRGEVIGVLDVQSTEAGAFGGEDVTILQMMADQLGMALENARLLEESQRALDELRVLYGEYARGAWERLGELPAFAYDRVQVAPVPPRADPLLQEVLRSGQVVAHPGEEEGRAALVAPLRLGEQVIGAIALEETEAGRVWSEDEIELVQAVSEQVARALESARLFQETQRALGEMESLYRAIQNVSTEFELEPLTEKLVQEACRLLNADYGVLVTIDPATGGMQHFKTAGIAPGECTLRDLPQGKGILKALFEGQTVRVEHLQDHPSFSGSLPPNHLPISSFLGVPLVYQNQVRGLLAVSNRATSPTFDQVSENLLATFAAQATVSIENARLFENVRRRAEQERLIAEITARVRASTDPEAILRTAMRELGQALGVDRALLRLGTADSDRFSHNDRR